MLDQPFILVAGLALAVAYQLFRAYRVQEESKKREELFQIVTENAADMIALVDVNGKRLYNSPAYRRILGYSAAELGATSAFDQIHPEDRFGILEAAREARKTGIGRKMEYRIRHKDGSWRVLESMAGTIRDDKGEVAKLVIVNRDITERKRAERLAEHNALHDGLTGLPNRRLFLDRLRSLYERSKRHPDRQHALLLVDLDGFNRCNEELGPAVADGVLVEMGSRIEKCLRDEDTVARGKNDLVTKTAVLSRLGGDDFTILLEGVTDPSDAMRAGERILAAMARPIAVGERELRITSSIGIALGGATQARAEGVLLEAEVALRRAQALGGSRCEIFDEAMHTRAAKRMQLEGELRQALHGDQFRILYQPILSLINRRITGFEALLRWQHPERGLISPDKFLAAAEDIGLLVSVGQWLMRAVCERLRAWSETGPAAEITMSFNLSPKQFRDPHFVEDIEAILRATHVDPSRLQVELTEAVAETDLRLIHDVLIQLKRLRISAILDDFGTGSSSLSGLRKLPLEGLKIDRSLIDKMPVDRETYETIDLIVTLAGKLKLHAIAEGIETRKQWEMLRELGCEMGQGFFFSPAVDAEAAAKLLAEWSAAGKAKATGR